MRWRSSRERGVSYKIANCAGERNESTCVCLMIVHAGWSVSKIRWMSFIINPCGKEPRKKTFGKKEALTTWCKFSHQMQHFFRWLAFLLNDSGAPAPPNLQTFQSWLQSEISDKCHVMAHFTPAHSGGLLGCVYDSHEFIKASPPTWRCVAAPLWSAKMYGCACLF